MTDIYLKFRRRFIIIVFSVIILLFPVFIYFVALYIEDPSLSVISEKQNVAVSNQTAYFTLAKGHRFSGEFTALHDNLGIIGLVFDTQDKTVDDEIVIRLKEIGDTAWHYENVYNTRQFITGSLLPIGFPIIAKSKGNTYQLEIELIGKDPKNLIYLDMGAGITTKYKFRKLSLLLSPSDLTEFIQAKRKAVSIDERVFLVPLSYPLFLILYLRIIMPLIMKTVKNQLVVEKFIIRHVPVFLVIVLLLCKIIFGLEFDTRHLLEGYAVIFALDFLFYKPNFLDFIVTFVISGLIGSDYFEYYGLRDCFALMTYYLLLILLAGFILKSIVRSRSKCEEQ